VPGVPLGALLSGVASGVASVPDVSLTALAGAAPDAGGCGMGGTVGR
jgi:hypothetical protein